MKREFFRFKRTTAIVAVFCMMFTLVPISTFAAQTSDIANHWAKDKIQNWMDKGLIKGYEDGTFRPDGNITRAEFMTLVNGAFGYAESATIKFTDVKGNEWYADAVDRAKSAGYVSGYPDNTIKPNHPISRAEAACMIMKLNKLEEDSSDVIKFTDRSSFNWSKSAVNAVATAKIMKGYPDGSFKPEEFIKRAEAVVALDNALDYGVNNITYSKAGTYGPETGVLEIEGNVTVTEKGIKLQNMLIKGNLIIGENVGNGNVTLNNITVKGETMVYGGGQNSIIIINSTLGKVTVSKKDGKIRIVISGSTTVKEVLANSGVKLEERNLTGNSEGFQEIILDASEDDIIILQGTFSQVDVQSEGIKVDIPKGTTVERLVLDKKTTVTGTGMVANADIRANGVTFQTAPRKTNVSNDVKAPVIKDSTSSSGGGGGGGHSSKVALSVAVTKLETAPNDINITDSQANQDAISVSQTRNAVTVIGNLALLNEFASTNPAQGTHKWVGLVINTGEDDITTVSYDGSPLTAADVDEATSVGAPAGSFVLWIKTEEVVTTPKTVTLSKTGKADTTITIHFTEIVEGLLTMRTLTVSAADDPADTTNTIITVQEPLDKNNIRLYIEYTGYTPGDDDPKVDEVVVDGGAGQGICKWKTLPTGGSIEAMCNGVDIIVLETTADHKVRAIGNTKAVVAENILGKITFEKTKYEIRINEEATGVVETYNTYVLTLTNGTPKTGDVKSAVTVTGLPEGLEYTVIGDANAKIITITVSGTANSPVTNEINNVRITVAASAVSETNGVEDADEVAIFRVLIMA